jgi:hypothetical protein
MAGIFKKVTSFARSAQGQKLIKQAQAAAKDPANRAKVQQLGNQLKARGEQLRGRNQSKPPVPGEVVEKPPAEQ